MVWFWASSITGRRAVRVCRAWQGLFSRSIYQSVPNRALGKIICTGTSRVRKGADMCKNISFVLHSGCEIQKGLGRGGV